MNYIAILRSRNYVYKLGSALENKGYKFEIVSTPSHVSKGGCGLCLKFPEELMEVVIAVANESNTPIKEVYSINSGHSKNKYRRI
ncbi:MAG TPA: DUF3343 domain-containing protein [Ruminiclostridium sp.]